MIKGTSHKVAVLGAGGLTGRFLVAGLRDNGIATRAVLRRETYAERMPDGVEIATADLNDVGALCRAFEDCTAVYMIPPSFNEGEEKFIRSTVEAMGQAGVRRFIYHAVLHPMTPDMPHHLRKSRVELVIRESELEWTILEPAMYVQTVLSFLSQDRTIMRPPFDPDRPFNVLAPADLVGSVLRVLSDRETAYGTFELAGSERLSIREMAAQLSGALGHQVDVKMTDMETQVASRSAKRGWSESQQQEYRAMLSYYGRFGLPGNGMTLEMLLARPATPFAVAAQALLKE